MSKKRELITTKTLVKNILENESASRNSDNLLYLRVIGKVAERKGIDLDSISVSEYLKSMSELGFPPFETVRRVRQNIQEHNPELSSIERIQAKRKENEKVFRKFARGEL